MILKFSGHHHLLTPEVEELAGNFVLALKLSRGVAKVETCGCHPRVLFSTYQGLDYYLDFDPNFRVSFIGILPGNSLLTAFYAVYSVKDEYFSLNNANANFLPAAKDLYVALHILGFPISDSQTEEFNSLFDLSAHDLAMEISK